MYKSKLFFVRYQENLDSWYIHYRLLHNESVPFFFFKHIINNNLICDVVVESPYIGLH